MEGVVTKLHDPCQFGPSFVVQLSMVYADFSSERHCLNVDVLNGQSCVASDVGYEQRCNMMILCFVLIRFTVEWLQKLCIWLGGNFLNGRSGITSDLRHVRWLLSRIRFLVGICIITVRL